MCTNDVHYAERDDWRAHEILLNVQSGEPCEIWERDSFGNPKNRILNPKRKVLASHEHYFKSPQQMKELFADHPESVQATQEIAQKISFEFDFKAKYYPVFYPPGFEGNEKSQDREKAAEEYLKKLCLDAIAKRYQKKHLEKVQEKYPNEDPLSVVHKRLEYELGIIFSKGLCDYLLIVYDFIAWAKNQRIPVGPGRGSGAGSIILYLIGITDIEPLRFNLFFERFINPERLSYPDIDVDICMERRGEVIEYTLRKYGREKVAQIITFGTMKAKMAIKDVGRVLSVSLAKVNDIAKLVPEDPGMTLEKAIELDLDLARVASEDEEGKRIIDLALKLEGSIRNTGVHAAGLIICGDSLTDHIPVCTPKDSEMITTQYSMKPVESVGMLKIDFLGLKTLTSIQKTVDAIKKGKGIDIDWVNLPLEDKSTFDLLNQGKTSGVFQLESTGMQELAKQLHIDRFEEIIAAGALYRPGPMEMIPSFINRKHGREAIELDHPWMETIIQETYGIMVYQEQVMQIASKLAGYSLGEGDVLRRAMGKKDREEMASQREKFKAGAVQNEIDEALSMAIFDKIEKFASYGFNKSHAAAYGYLSYVTAYLKSNYPREWLASLMTCDMDDLTKVAKHIRESRSMQIEVLPPDVNVSQHEFTAVEEGIRFGLSGIKGVGRGVVEVILHEREQGPFQSLREFLQRIDTRKVGKKAVESLIEAGSFDFTKRSRKALLSELQVEFEVAARRQKEKEQGIMDLFHELAMEEETQPIVEEKEEFSREERLAKEKELLGFFLTGHPMDEYGERLKAWDCLQVSEVAKKKHPGVYRVAAIIESAKVRISAKNQRKFCILTISDGIEHYELPIWSTLYDGSSQLLNENQLIICVIETEKDEDQVKFKCHWIEDLTSKREDLQEELKKAVENAEARLKNQKKREKKGAAMERKQSSKKITLRVDADQMRFSHVLQLKEILSKYAGRHQVQLDFFSNKNRIGLIDLFEESGVHWDESLGETLTKLSFIHHCEVSDTTG